MLFSKAKWLAFGANVITTAHALEVDLVFPRNETYAPADTLPIVFAVQNTHGAELLNLQIHYDIRKDNDINTGISFFHDMRWVNWSNSSDPYLLYRYVTGINATGDWSVNWWLDWESCDEEALAGEGLTGYYGHRRGIIKNNYSWRQDFTIADSAPKEVDLVAATANATCPTDKNAVAIFVTDKTMESPSDLNSARRDTCVVTVNSTASATRTTTDPCRVAIDEEAAASMAVAWKKRLCNGLNPPDDCPDEKNAAQKSVVFGAFGSLAAFGAAGFALL